ncbi:MAG: discoidin domain-containing protein, partial [Thermoguttaceae bacterium]|nr:discoidin domain-containing protein [Thermoguttaceae bacterium]
MNRKLSLFALALAVAAAGICQFAASCAWADESRPKLCKLDVIVNSENRLNEAFRACDGNLHTFWHTRFEAPAVEPPHWIALDLLEPMTVEGFDYTPREDMTNGTFENVKVYVCDSLEDKGEPVWTGVVYPKYEQPVKTVRINFPAPATGRYIFFDVVNALSNIARASAAEIQPIVKGKVFLHKDIVEFYESMGVDLGAIVDNGLISTPVV